MRVGIGGPEERERRHAERVGQVERSGVAGRRRARAPAASAREPGEVESGAHRRRPGSERREALGAPLRRPVPTRRPARGRGDPGARARARRTAPRPTPSRRGPRPDGSTAIRPRKPRDERVGLGARHRRGDSARPGARTSRGCRPPRAARGSGRRRARAPGPGATRTRHEQRRGRLAADRARRSRRRGAPAARARIADFQRPCTSSDDVRRESDELARAAAPGRASVAAAKRTAPPRLRVGDEDRSTQLGFPSRTPAKRALDDPADPRSRRGARSRRAAARGSTSPIAERRTIRASTFDSFASGSSPTDVRRRVILGIADDHRPAAVARDDLALGDARRRCSRCPWRGRPGGARRSAPPASPRRRARPRPRTARAATISARSASGRIGPRRPLRARDRSVGVDADDEPVALAARGLEVADVADVEEVERAVGEDDASSRRRARAPRLRGARRASGSSRRSSVPSSVRHGSGPPRRPRRSSSGVTTAVPIFMTTTPPAKLASSAASSGEAPGREREREGREHGVAGAGDVGDLIGAVDGDALGAAPSVEERHAPRAARDEEAARSRIRSRSAAARRLEPRLGVVRAARRRAPRALPRWASRRPRRGTRGRRCRESTQIARAAAGARARSAGDRRRRDRAVAVVGEDRAVRAARRVARRRSARRRPSAPSGSASSTS